jgi:hypothetical protein
MFCSLDTSVYLPNLLKSIDEDVLFRVGERNYYTTFTTIEALDQAMFNHYDSLEKRTERGGNLMTLKQEQVPLATFLKTYVELADEQNWNNKTKIQNLASKLASSHLAQSLRLLVSIYKEWDFERCCKHILELEESLAKAKPVNMIHFQNHFPLYPDPNPQGYQQLGGQPVFALQQQSIGPVGMAPPAGPSKLFHRVCYHCGEPGHKGFECSQKRQDFCKHCRKSGHNDDNCRAQNHPKRCNNHGWNRNQQYRQKTKNRFYNKNAQSDPAYYHPTANRIPSQPIRNAPPEEGRQRLTTPEVSMVQQLLDESKKRKADRKEDDTPNKKVRFNDGENKEDIDYESLTAKVHAHLCAMAEQVLDPADRQEHPLPPEVEIVEVTVAKDRNSNLEEVCSVELGKKEPVRKPPVFKERIVQRRQEMHKSPYWQCLRKLRTDRNAEEREKVRLELLKEAVLEFEEREQVISAECYEHYT